MPTTTVVSVDRVPGTSGTGSTKTASADEKQTYLVVFSDVNATSVDARNATYLSGSLTLGVPAYGTQLVSQLFGPVNMFLTEKTAIQNEKRRDYWTVDVTYTILDANSQPPIPAGFASGDKYGVTVAMQGLPTQVAIEKDNNGKVIANTNKEPLDPPITKAIYDKQLNVTFWSDKVDQTSIDACIDKTNSATVTMTIGAGTWTFAVNTLLFNNYSWTVSYDATGVKVFQVTFEFIYRKDTWQIVVPNTSYGKLNGSGDFVPFLDAMKKPYTSPRYIDASGNQIAAGATFYPLTFDVLSTTNFNTALLVGIP